MFKTQVEPQASGFTARFWTFYGVISMIYKSVDHGNYGRFVFTTTFIFLRKTKKHNSPRCVTFYIISMVYLTNRFHVAVRLFSNRSQMTSKCGKNKKVAQPSPPHMSNTPELSRVVFTLGRIESDGDRKRKWVYGRWSVVAEVTVNRSEGGWKSRQTDSIGSDGDSSSREESIGLSEVSSRVTENTNFANVSLIPWKHVEKEK